MKNINQKMLSKILSNKVRGYVKIANISFTLSIVLFAIVVIFVWNQYQQIKINFVDNEKTHIITISGQTTSNGYVAVNNNFKKEIISALDKADALKGCECFSIYQFITMPAVQELPGETVAVFSIDKNGEKYWLSGTTMEDGCIYTTKENSGMFTILVPTVEEIDGNLYFGDEKSYQMKASLLNEKDIYAHLYDEAYQLTEFYISFNTFKELYEYATGYSISTDSVDEDFGMSSTYEIVIYVKDITKVENVAKILNDQGYTTNFVFASFEDLGESLGTSFIVMLTLSASMMIVTFIILLLSWKNYVSLLSKDIGILKQMGYQDKFIKKVYDASIKKNFIISFVLIFIVTIITSVIVLGIDQYAFILSLIFVIAILFFISYFVISYFFLGSLIKKNVLQLLKGKTFE